MSSLRRRAPGDHRLSLRTGLMLVSVWHAIGAAAALVLVLLASRTGEQELPWKVSIFLRVFGLAALIAHVYASFGVVRGHRRARSVSLVVNYLVMVIMSVAALHQLGAFTGIGTLGEGFNKAFVPFLVVLVGLLWVLVAGQLLTQRPTARGPLALRKAGWLLTAAAGATFVIVADPSGMLAAIGDQITKPVTLG